MRSFGRHNRAALVGQERCGCSSHPHQNCLIDWLVIGLVSAQHADRPGWIVSYLGLYGPIALGVWLLGILVHRVVVRRRNTRISSAAH